MLVLSYISSSSPRFARDRSSLAFTLRASFITLPGRRAFAGLNQFRSFLLEFFMIFCVRLGRQLAFIVFLAFSIQLRGAQSLKPFLPTLARP